MVEPENAESIARQTRLPRNVILVFAHIDPRALGLALGLILGFWIWLATVIVVARSDSLGPYLTLLSQYFFGFAVTPAGSLVGFAYGFLIGFISGYLFAKLRNVMMHAYMVFLKRRAEKDMTTDLLDRLT